MLLNILQSVSDYVAHGMPVAVALFDMGVSYTIRTVWVPYLESLNPKM